MTRPKEARPPAAAPPFAGFGADAYPFLRALAENQSKAWFDRNRGTFDAHLKLPLCDLVEHLAAVLAKRKSPLTGTAAGSVFRMNRDIRFAKDKSPYKTSVGAALSRSGDKKAVDGILYIHIDPAGSFLAAGFYRPEPPVLNCLRSAIKADPAGFRQVIAKLQKEGLSLDADDSLVRLPKGFEDIDGDDLKAAVRLKSLIVSRPVDEPEVLSAEFADMALELAADALPLLQFGWKALDAAAPPPADPSEDAPAGSPARTGRGKKAGGPGGVS